MKKTYRFLSLVFFVGSHLSAHADQLLGFSDVWISIKSDHPELIASRENLNAAQSSASRSELHWLPSLSFSGKGYSTNDSTQNFMGNLGQRSIMTSDFIPDTLNRPGAHSFAQLTLGAELPIYEGGRSAANSQMQKFNLQASQNQNSSELIEIYVQSVSLYAGVLNSNEALASLDDLKSKVNGILSKYSLGSRSNPIGYSGLLGLKSINNRIQASMNEVKLLKDSAKDELLIRAKKLTQDWQPKQENISQFLFSSIPDAAIHATDDSFTLTAGALYSEMQNSRISLERSRFLPQFGLFADANYLLGSRSSASGYIGGVYLRWSVFNPKDFGIVDESKHLFLASRAHVDGDHQNEQISRERLFLTLSTLDQNEKLLADSSELMTDQVATTSRLFHSGSLNVLQMVEVFNRRADLIIQLHDLHKQQIMTRIQLAKLSRLNGVQL